MIVVVSMAIIFVVIVGAFNECHLSGLMTTDPRDILEVLQDNLGRFEELQSAAGQEDLEQGDP